MEKVGIFYVYVQTVKSGQACNPYFQNYSTVQSFHNNQKKNKISEEYITFVLGHAVTPEEFIE